MLGDLANPIGIGIVLIANAIGLGKIVRGAADAISRQPEIAGKIYTLAIIAGTALEGTVFFANIAIKFWG